MSACNLLSRSVVCLVLCLRRTTGMHEFLGPFFDQMRQTAAMGLSVPFSIGLIFSRSVHFVRHKTKQTRSSAIDDKPRVLVCKVVEVWQDFLSEYVDKKFTYICYRRLIRHE